jgi:hypothetical protein
MEGYEGITCENVDWIQLVQDMDLCGVTTETRIAIGAENFMTSWTINPWR